MPKQNFPVSCEISSKYLEISFFSCTNFTFVSVSEESSIAWLNPFSPPYETSTVFSTWLGLGFGLGFGLGLGSGSGLGLGSGPGLGLGLGLGAG